MIYRYHYKIKVPNGLVVTVGLKLFRRLFAL
jgi:hypothetical protein